MEVHLEENPSTGYRWEVLVSTGPQIVKDEYVHDGPTHRDGELLVGGGGTRILRIEGSGEITLIHHQPWPGGDKVEQRTYKLP